MDSFSNAVQCSLLTYLFLGEKSEALALLSQKYKSFSLVMFFFNFPNFSRVIETSEGHLVQPSLKAEPTLVRFLRALSKVSASPRMKISSPLQCKQLRAELTDLSVSSELKRHRRIGEGASKRKVNNKVANQMFKFKSRGCQMLVLTLQSTAQILSWNFPAGKPRGISNSPERFTFDCGSLPHCK